MTEETFWIVKWKNRDEYTVASRRTYGSNECEWYVIGDEQGADDDLFHSNCEVIKELDLNKIINDSTLLEQVRMENQLKEEMLHSECKGECYDIPIGFFERCLWCKVKWICEDDYGFLADRDSDHCRMLHYHYGGEK